MRKNNDYLVTQKPHRITGAKSLISLSVFCASSNSISSFKYSTNKRTACSNLPTTGLFLKHLCRRGHQEVAPISLRTHQGQGRCQENQRKSFLVQQVMRRVHQDQGELAFLRHRSFSFLHSVPRCTL